LPKKVSLFGDFFSGWTMSGAAGAADAILFKKTGRLAPAVILHMVYNAVVVVWT
jgi:hypothetical protein